jgi:hypothetical protein
MLDAKLRNSIKMTINTKSFLVLSQTRVGRRILLFKETEIGSES